MINELHVVLNLLVPAVAVAAIGALAKLLASSQVANAIQSLSVKLAAETEKLLAEADATHNALLIMAVHAAMSYAENHETEVLKEFDSKADYVIDAIERDPRFAHLNLPLDTLKHLVEQLYTQYFASLNAYDKGPATVKPADVTGGGPGAPQPATAG